jgi:mono/diheme cytochrome c family protein
MRAKRAVFYCTLVLTLLSTAYPFDYVAKGEWIKRVPASEHSRTNPYEGQADAVAAGRRVFVEHCSHCHGENAEGTKKRPPLHSDRIQREATAGDLHWILTNGNMGKGMPPWTKLPDEQRWQVITYLKSLQN